MIKTLMEMPNLYTQTIDVIEKSFNYSEENSFDTDFSPLVSESNQQDCFIYIENDEVVGHVGVLNYSITLNGSDYKVSTYGGIAVSEDHRGKGIFKKLFNHAIDKNAQSALHLLWSDQLEMYEKFNFHPCIEQYETISNLEDAEGYIQTKLIDLSNEKIEQLKSIYDQSSEVRFKRTLDDWDKLKGITSSDLYIKEENGFITNYFFMNKGEDLEGVIIEVGDFNKENQLLPFGVLWSPYQVDETSSTLFAAVAKIGDKKLFSDFINNYTNKMIEIHGMNDDVVEFSFEKNSFNLSHNDFLQGVFGPGQFQELNELSPLYISGLDSI